MIHEEKSRLRRELGARRRQLSAAEAAEVATACAAHWAGDPRLAAARRVALYAALPDELPTRPLFEQLRAGGVECLFPRIEGDDLVFRPVAAWDELAAGRFGVLEPAPGAPAALGPGDLAVLPGVAFDADGWRLGRGRGFYDRAFPPASPAPTLVGLAYALQLVAAVPHDSRDRRVDAMVTERGVRWVGAGSAGGGA